MTSDRMMDYPTDQASFDIPFPADAVGDGGRLCGYCEVRPLLTNKDGSQRKNATNCGNKDCKRKHHNAEKLKRTKTPEGMARKRAAAIRYLSTEKGKETRRRKNDKDKSCPLRRGVKRTSARRRYKLDKSIGRCAKCRKQPIARTSVSYCIHCKLYLSLKNHFLSLDEFYLMIFLQKYRGFHTGDPITIETASIDHFVSKDWCIRNNIPPQVYNRSYNIVLDTKEANSSKRNLDVDIWYKIIGKQKKEVRWARQKTIEIKQRMLAARFSFQQPY